jgi:hypothetical protein
VSEDADTRRADDPAASDEGRLKRFAASLGLDLPVFEGPLSAFVLEGGRGPILLGGDLHAVHPESANPPAGDRDRSLDAATVIVDDQEHPPLKTAAVEGIWCLALPDDLLDSAPYFTLWDTEGRLRAWLLLPAAAAMIGIGHFWLPQIKPPPDTPGATSSRTARLPPTS